MLAHRLSTLLTPQQPVNLLINTIRPEPMPKFDSNLIHDVTSNSLRDSFTRDIVEIANICIIGEDLRPCCNVLGGMASRDRILTERVPVLGIDETA